jgi:hypothetical protein
MANGTFSTDVHLWAVAHKSVGVVKNIQPRGLDLGTEREAQVVARQRLAADENLFCGAGGMD